MFAPEPLCTVEELRKICLWPSGIQEFPTENMDEVYSNIFLGNAAAAENIEELHNKGIGYILNAAHGTDSSLNMVEGLTEKEYMDCGIVFLGVPAIDMMSYDLEQHFEVAVGFIGAAIGSGGRVLVHCKQGISRSAALIVAYLVQNVGLALQDAVRVVRQRREILPNDGFLLQLCKFNERINKKY